MGGSKTDVLNVAKDHWKYTEEVIVKASSSSWIELLEYVYIEAFIHGYKHGKEDYE